MVDASPGLPLLLDLRLLACFSLLLNFSDTVETEQEALRETFALASGKKFLLVGLVPAVARRVAVMDWRRTSSPHGDCPAMIAARLAAC